MIPAPLSLAKSDPRLTAAAHRVLALCVERHLEDPPTAGVVARLCKMDRGTARRALRRLTDAGYLAKAA
jgi:DNA-binding IclR family transcriptional regulator